MKLELRSVVKLLLLFVLCATLVNGIKTEMLLQITPEEQRSIARITAYISLILSSCAAFIIVGAILSTPWFALKSVKSNISLFSYLSGAQAVIKILISAEIAKLVLLFLFLKNDVKNIDLTMDFESQVKALTWYRVNQISEITLLSSACLAMALVLKRNNVKLDEVAIATIILLILFLGQYLIF